MAYIGLQFLTRCTRTTAARTRLRQEELRQLIWDDMGLDEAEPNVRVRVVSAKNKTEERVPVVPEIVEELRAHRSASARRSDLVSPNSVPRCARLQGDLKANGITYQDEFGGFLDFHPLRHTCTTFLDRNRVSPRFAMKVLRQRDPRLTTLVYTDELQLLV